MIKTILSALFNIENNKNSTYKKTIIRGNNPIKIENNNKEEEIKKDELIDKLIEIYKKNDELSHQKRIISKEELQKIPLNILKNEYNKELKKYNHINLQKESKTTINNTNKKNSTYAYLKIKKSNKQKGMEYEKQVGKFFEKQGYIVKYNGIENDKKDNSIDLIAIKKNEIILIQCKNWKENSKYKITLHMVKAFIGDTYKFIEENPTYKEYNIKRLFVISNKILSKSAYIFIKNNPKIINYQIIKEIPNYK